MMMPTVPGDGSSRRFQALNEDPRRVAGAYAILVLLVVFIVVHTNVVILPIHGAFYDARRILQVILLAGAAVTLGISRALRGSILELVCRLPTVVHWLVPGMVILGVLSALRAPLPSAALREVALLMGVGLVALVVAATHRNLGQRFERAIVVTLVAAGLLYFVLFVLFRLAHIELMGIEHVRRSSTHFFYGWSNARFFGQAATWVLPLLVAAPLVLRDRPVVTRGTCAAVAVIWWALLLEAGGRGSIAFVLIGAVVTFALLGRLAWPWFRATLGVLGGGTVVWLAGNRLLEWTFATGGAVDRAPSPVGQAVARGVTDEARLEFWAQALELIAAHPVLGAGPEHFAYHTRVWAAHPHNAVLQIAAEWGLPVAVALWSLIGWAAVAWVQRWRGRPPPPDGAGVIVTALTASGVSAGMLAMVDGVVMTPASQVMLALVAGWMLSLYHESSEHRPDPLRRVGTELISLQGRVAHAALTLSAVTIVGTLVVTASPYLWSPRESLDARMEQHELPDLLPRFWVQGRLFDE